MYNFLLDVFITVSDCGSFSKAAQKLFLSTPGVMKEVDRLENQLGLVLFDRNNRGVTLTAAGAEVYKGSKIIIAQSQQILKEAKGL